MLFNSYQFKINNRKTSLCCNSAIEKEVCVCVYTLTCTHVYVFMYMSMFSAIWSSFSFLVYLLILIYKHQAILRFWECTTLGQHVAYWYSFFFSFSSLRGTECSKGGHMASMFDSFRAYVHISHVLNSISISPQQTFIELFVRLDYAPHCGHTDPDRCFLGAHCSRFPLRIKIFSLI